MRGKKARATVARADRDVRKRLSRVAAAQQRMNDALARLVRLNQVYGTAYPEQTDLSAGFDDYSAGARQLVGAYAVVEALPALAVVPDTAGGLALAGEAIFGELPTAPRPRAAPERGHAARHQPRGRGQHCARGPGDGHGRHGGRGGAPHH
ncbi:hypothetical protein BEN49_20475 [Hymenobacter coccineus]|uniref:Uncharacterized protein n=1 Tax=Hymenobacter coccineus TaxID=1908235 RepID=A0A1G1TK64_9BACT|nr:hypothetical protein BEN49_20475 [Hymenobacter coccineus]